MVMYVWPVCGGTGNYDRGIWIYVAYKRTCCSVVFEKFSGARNL